MDAVLRRLKAMASNPPKGSAGIEVGPSEDYYVHGRHTTITTKTTARGAWSRVTKTTQGSTHRPAALNADIVEQQRAVGRDPFKLTDHQRGVMRDQFSYELAHNGHVLLAALSSVADLFLSFVKQNFAKGENSAPLSAKYQAWKDRHFPGMPPMVRTGGLLKSLVAKVIRG
jgi:hypothetical protein